MSDSSIQQDNRLFRWSYYDHFIINPMRPPIRVEPIPFTDTELKNFDKILDHKRGAQKNKMRQVFQSCGMTESTFKRSGSKELNHD